MHSSSLDFLQPHYNFERGVLKVWITGKEGLLGRTLTLLCQERGVPCVATGKEEVSVTSLDALLRFGSLHTPSHIINCAAYTDVDRAEKEALIPFLVNGTGAGYVGRVAQQLGARVVHVSTDYVFSGSEKTSPFKETDVCHPVGVYAMSKWEGEQRLLEEAPQGCIVRTSWLFGSKGKNFISTLLPRLGVEEKMVAVEDQFSKATFVRDLGEVLLKLLGASGVFHFANEGVVSRYQVAKEMGAQALTLGLPVRCKEIVPVKGTSFTPLAKRPDYSVLCTEKITQFLGTAPDPWNLAIGRFLEEEGRHAAS